jgi:peptide/nickel transport system permease protein
MAVLEQGVPSAAPAAGGRPARPLAQRLRIPLLILRRLVGMLISLVAVLVLNFFLFNVLSSDPARAMARNRHMSAEALVELRHRMGYDKPLSDRFWISMQQLFLHGVLGISFKYNQPVMEVIGHYVWPTVLLVGTSTILSSLIGTWLGIAGAWRRGTVFDKITNGTAVTLYAMPEFWLGIMFLLFLAGNQVGLGIFPTAGMNDPNNPGSWTAVIWHLTLPCLTLTLAYLAQYSLVMRSSMLDEMGQDYVLTARAKGLREALVRSKHVVPNALIPAVTQILLYFGFVISGAITIEYVYSWPGLGQLTEDAVNAVDLPLLQGLFLIFTTSVLVFNMIADVMIGVLDPRVREL